MDIDDVDERWGPAADHAGGPARYLRDEDGSVRIDADGRPMTELKANVITGMQVIGQPPGPEIREALKRRPGWRVEDF